MTTARFTPPANYRTASNYDKPSPSAARAKALAELALTEGVKLPGPVAAAFARRQELLDEPVPPRPVAGDWVAHAIRQAAGELLHAPGTDLDAGAQLAGEARAAETMAADRAAVLTAARAYADAAVVEVVESEKAAVVKSIQTRYSQVAGRFVTAARLLPPGLDNPEVALRMADEIRLAWISHEDLRLAILELRRLVELVAPPLTPPDAKTRAYSWVRSSAVADRLEVRRGPLATSWGEQGSMPFLRRLAENVDASLWWAPSVDEARAFAGAVRQPAAAALR
jgi:hypothetical protein